MDFIAILFIIISIVLKILEAGKKDSKKVTSERNNYTGSLEKMKPLLSKIKDEISNALDLNDNRPFNENKDNLDSKIKNANKPKSYINVNPIIAVDTDHKKEENKLIMKNYKTECVSKDEKRTEDATYDSKLTLDFSEEDLIKSVIMCEILNKPVSKRGAR